jgi:ornithine carbamoyltransferase
VLKPPVAPASLSGTPLSFGGIRLDPSSSADRELVLANARLLRHAVDPLQRQALLRGKNLALMCESPDSADATRFREAALDLGAHVAFLRSGLAELKLPAVRQHTARLLGRLYQGIECQGLSADLVAELGREAGIPVYDGVATATHPFAALAGSLDEQDQVEKNRRLVVQAVLVSTVG